MTKVIELENGHYFTNHTNDPNHNIINYKKMFNNKDCFVCTHLNLPHNHSICIDCSIYKINKFKKSKRINKKT